MQYCGVKYWQSGCWNARVRYISPGWHISCPSEVDLRHIPRPSEVDIKSKMLCWRWIYLTGVRYMCLTYLTGARYMSAQRDISCPGKIYLTPVFQHPDWIYRSLSITGSTIVYSRVDHTIDHTKGKTDRYLCVALRLFACGISHSIPNRGKAS